MNSVLLFLSTEGTHQSGNKLTFFLCYLLQTGLNNYYVFFSDYAEKNVSSMHLREAMFSCLMKRTEELIKSIQSGIVMLSMQICVVRCFTNIAFF